MWLKAHLKLSSRGPYEIPNRYKAAVQLTRSIAADFGDVDRATALSNKEFSAHLGRDLKGGRVRGGPAMALGEHTGSSQNNLKAWFVREKPWFSAIVLCTIFCCTSWLLPYRVLGLFWLGVWLWPVLAFSLAFGTTGRSRLFFSGCWLALGIAWILPMSIGFARE
jgi:hypothetical protein